MDEEPRNALLDILTILDTPGSVVRGLIGGDPGRAFGGVFDPSQRMSGTEMLGLDQEGFGNQALGFGASLLTDPMTYLGGLGLAKAGKGIGWLLRGGDAPITAAESANIMKLHPPRGAPKGPYPKTEELYRGPPRTPPPEVAEYIRQQKVAEEYWKALGAHWINEGGVSGFVLPVPESYQGLQMPRAVFDRVAQHASLPPIGSAAGELQFNPRQFGGALGERLRMQRQLPPIGPGPGGLEEAMMGAQSGVSGAMMPSLPAAQYRLPFSPDMGMAASVGAPLGGAALLAALGYQDGEGYY